MLSMNQKIHFVGVGGCGMSGIAEILQHRGFIVSGSDTKCGQATKRLEKIGVSVAFSHHANNVHGKDMLVVSSAIQPTNPEILEAQKFNIPIVHRTEMLAELMRSKENIVVAGTHGKTTTTSILSHVLQSLDLDPTTVIGGQMHSFESGAKFGQSKFFIAEADESDGSFLRLRPHIAIITNIDRDHLEYYGTLEEIFKTFERFVAKVPTDGTVCLCTDDLLTKKLIPNIKSNILTYGLHSNARISAKNIKTNGLQTTFSPIIDDTEYPEVTLNLPGRYNVLNALASFAVAHAFNLDMNKVGETLSFFKGTLHRYTILATIGHHLIVDDYAHNPKKIETVLAGTRESFPHKNIVAIFQPHRYTRVKEQGEEFAKCFSHADKLIIAPIYSAGETPIDGVTVENLSAKIIAQSFQGSAGRIQIAQNFEHIVDLCINYLAEHPDNGSIFLTLGAGDIAQVGHFIKERLTFEN